MLQGTSSRHGLRGLTERNIEIMRMLAEGLTLAEIADALRIACKTVANTCSQIKAKLGMARTNDLVRQATTMGVACGVQSSSLKRIGTSAAALTGAPACVAGTKRH